MPKDERIIWAELAALVVLLIIFAIVGNKDGRFDGREPVVLAGIALVMFDIFRRGWNK